MADIDLKNIFRSIVAVTLGLLVQAGNTEAAIQCYECHGTVATSDYRPIDGAYRNFSTGAFQGNHQTHMAAPATPGVCTKCHNNINYLSSHRNGFINFSSNINASPSPSKGKYMVSGSPVTAKAQNTAPVLGTCSNVNCHFETATPQWGSAPFSAPTDCDKCHGVPPNGGGTSGAAGSHAKHDTYYSGITNCQKCHSNNTTFSHATSAAHRNLNINFAAAPNNGNGVYSGALNDYLPSQTNAFGTCRALYCHSNGARGFAPYTSNTTATWGGSLTCKGCHKSDFASSDPMATGSHRAHINGTGVGYTQIKCVRCHAVTATAGMAITNPANHVNGQITVAFDNTSSAKNGTYNGSAATPASPSVKAPGSAYGSCTLVYCHSTGQHSDGTPLVGADYQTPTWNNPASGQCGTCHGIQTGHDASGFNYGIATPLTSGSHARHLVFVLGTGNVSAERKCAACHAYTLTGYTPNACGSTICHSSMAQKHSNYEINVGMPDYYGASASYNGTTRPGDGYGSCANVYCHSDGKAVPAAYATATWGNAASGACGTCHGVTASVPPASTPHIKHVGSVNPYRFACAECHSGKVQATSDATVQPAFTNLTTHVNKARNVSFDPTNPFGTYSSATQSCRNMYCHSTGNTSVAGGNLPGVYGGKVYSRITWSGSTTCTSCHGRSTASGMPDYANAGAAGSATANSHAKHVTSSSIQCVECHEKTTKNNTSIRSTTPGYHVNGTNHDVFFNLSGLSPSGTYDDAQKKCSATYCHGAGASLAWGGSTYCNSCHSSNAAAAGGGGVNNWGSGTPVSAHKLHWEDASALPSKYTNYSTGNLGSAGTYRFGCASCHNPTSTTHVNGYASGSYRAQVFFGYTSPGKKPTYTYTGTAGTADNGFAWSNGNTACTATYCHSNGNGGAGNTAVSWATTANSATNTRCKACHSYTTASGSLIATYKHSKHADGTTYSFGCAKCHNMTTTDGTSIADKTKHLNKVKDVAWDSMNSDGSAYVNSSTVCANIYCHSQGTTFAQPYTGAGKAPNTAVTWAGGQTLACNSCHGNINGYTTGTYRVATPLYASGSPKGNAHSSHVDARLGTDAGTQCLHCHNGTTTTNTSITTYANHVNEAYNVTGGGTFKDGDNISGAAGAVTVTYAYNASGSTCSNVSCHPTGTAGSKAASSTKWNNAHGCTDCHKVDLSNNTGYHHAMRNYSGSGASYPKTIPGSGSAGANDVSRRCTMCHVDHATFSPSLNTSNASYGSAGNLRMSIYSSVTATKGYTNTDFFKTGSGGICISCHNSELFKDTGNVRVKNESNSTKTVAIALNNYTGSAHEYAISSTMKRDSKVFYADCSKCHNGRRNEVAVFSGMTTATHDRDVRRIYASLGANLSDGNDENFCYRCHSRSSGDTNPGGGAAKTVANKDYYRTATMNTGSQLVFLSFTSTYGHNPQNYTGLHKPSPTDETRTYLSANKHVECADCHNVHASRQGNHTAGNGALAKVLNNVQGVVPTFSGTNWGGVTSYTAQTATAEYQICFKCHSGYNTNVTTWGGANATAWTDLGLEFNPANASYHPVVSALPAADPGANGSNRLAAGQLVNGWTPGMVMTCTDCHAASAPGASGPHGSSVKWMLAGTNKAWPYTTAALNGTNGTANFRTLAANKTTGQGTKDGLFCLNCHPSSNAVNNVHNLNVHQNSTYACVFCHIRVPHGGKVDRLMATKTAGLPGRYAPDGTSSASFTSNRWMNGFKKAATPTGYSDSGNCNSPCTGSHNYSGGSSW